MQSNYCVYFGVDWSLYGGEERYIRINPFYHEVVGRANGGGGFGFFHNSLDKHNRVSRQHFTVWTHDNKEPREKNPIFGDIYRIDDPVNPVQVKVGAFIQDCSSNGTWIESNGIWVKAEKGKVYLIRHDERILLGVEDPTDPSGAILRYLVKLPHQKKWITK